MLARSLLGLTLAIFLSACGKVDHSSPQEAASDAVDTGQTTLVTPGFTGEASYFRLFATTPDQVSRSSTLEWDGAACSLQNFYDFPDWIFGDSDLDNLTVQPLDAGACGRLSLARQIVASSGACTPSSVTLSSADKTQILVSSDIAALLASLAPGANISNADLVNAIATLELDASCVCSMTANLDSDSAQAVLPPPLDLCAQKFTPYAAHTP